MDDLVLRAGDAIARLDPLGGRLAQLTVADRQLLAPVTGPRTQAGCYPMVPWAGRLDRGRFSFAGTAHQMAITMEPHAIHGLGTDAPWDVVAPGVMQLDLDPLWPLGGVAEVRYQLTPTAITCTLTVSATNAAFPAVLGWHPCFVRAVAGAADTLGFEPGFMWTRGDDYLPTGTTEPSPPGPWDDCFGGVEASPTIRWGDEFAVELRAPTATWVVFDMLDTIVCVEPQTDTPNAFNLSGGTILEPGDSLTLPFEIAWGSTT